MPQFDDVTRTQQAMWSRGDFHRIGVSQVVVGEMLVRALGCRARADVAHTFGAMFAPDQEKTAGQLIRVLGPSGRLGMANWTPGSWVGAQFGLQARYLPPPDGVLPRPSLHRQSVRAVQRLVRSRAAAMTRHPLEEGVRTAKPSTCTPGTSAHSVHTWRSGSLSSPSPDPRGWIQWCAVTDS